MENKRFMESLGFRTLAASINESMANASSQNPDKPRNKNDHGRGQIHRSIFLELRAARKRKMKQLWWGFFTLHCAMYILMQVLITDLFILLY